MPFAGPERSGISATLRQQRRRVSVMSQSLLGGRLNKCANVRRKEEKLTLMELLILRNIHIRAPEAET
jgi:hypothetical protein